MKNKKAFMVCLLIMIIAIISMGINGFVIPLPDMVIRVTGIVMLIDLSALSYNWMKLKNSSN
ncbi:MAG: hypothetical protein WCD89_02200 [Anaerocolumna sp.]